MRILDINDNELQREDIDFDEGYLEQDKIFKTHHDEVPGTPREWHYKVLNIYFEDGGKYTPISEEDPHIKVPIDPHSSKFEYIPEQGQEPRKIRGMSLEEVTDVDAVDSVPAWDEYEDIERYIEYSEEEKASRAESARIAETKEELLLTGLKRIRDLEEDVGQKTAQIIDLTNDRGMDFEMIQGQISAMNENIGDNIATIDDLVLTMADILGGEL